eukprot:jgi/Galph1/2038/GphlegSOOS_G719.1
MIMRFTLFCSALEDVKKVASGQEKLEKIESLNNFAVRDDVVPSRRCEAETSLLVLRLLLPELDRERRSYGLKEKGLAELYIDVLELSNASFDAQRLRNWQDPVVQQTPGFLPATAGDFPSVLESVLRYRCPRTGSYNVGEVDHLLNDLNGFKEKIDRRNTFHKFASCCTVIENIWICRIILKEMHLGIGNEAVLRWFHPSALEDYHISQSLWNVCRDCSQPRFFISSQDVCLGQPAAVCLAKRQENLDRIAALMPEGFIMEPKFDGERLQVHKKGDIIQCFSRNAMDTTDLYGPHLQSAILLSVDAKDCILDGEVLLWNDENQSFEHFDQIRHYLASFKDISIAETLFITYVVFDVLYVDQGAGDVPPSIISFPLEWRRTILKKIIKPFHSQIRLVVSRIGRTVEDIKQTMEEYVEQKYEGVIIKNLKKPYLLGERSDKVMIKLKSDYFSGMIEDLDVLILGAYLGRGHFKRVRVGKPSHFLIGVLDKENNGQNAKWVVVGKVGSGYSYEELEQLQQKLSPHWIPFVRKSPPSYLANVSLKGDAEPDLWIEPKDSVVLTIRAFEVRPSLTYSGYALRFPRVVRIRWDKLWHECSTLEEILLDKKHNFNIQWKGDSEQPKKKRKPNTTAKGQLLSRFQATYWSSDKPHSQYDQGPVICLIGASNREEKQRFEGIIQHLGGTVVQSVIPNTTFVVALSQNHVSVSNMIKSFEKYVCYCISSMCIVDCGKSPQGILRKGSLRRRAQTEPKSVLQANWVSFRQYFIGQSLYTSSCWIVKKTGCFVDVLPYHVLWGTEDLKQDMRARCDSFGDSWTEQIDEEQLEEILNYMNVPVQTERKTVEEIINECVELKGIDSSGIFRQWQVLVDDFKHDCDTDSAACLLLYFAATLVVEKDKEVKHNDLGDSSLPMYYLVSEIPANGNAVEKNNLRLISKQMKWNYFPGQRMLLALS